MRSERMARYIDADKLMNEIDKLRKSPWYNDDYDYNSAIRCARHEAVEIVVDLCIKCAPTADVGKIVWCKDCKYLTDFYGECSKAHKRIVQPDDFCSHERERKK